MSNDSKFEYVGYRKYGIVIAAKNNDEAERIIKMLGNKWPDFADEIGFDCIDASDPIDVSSCKSRKTECHIGLKRGKLFSFDRDEIIEVSK